MFKKQISKESFTFEYRTLKRLDIFLPRGWFIEFQLLPLVPLLKSQEIILTFGRPRDQGPEFDAHILPSQGSAKHIRGRSIVGQANTDPPAVQESFDLSYQRILALPRRSFLLVVNVDLLQSDHVTVDVDGIPLVQLVHRPCQPDLHVPRIFRDGDAGERQCRK